MSCVCMALKLVWNGVNLVSCVDVDSQLDGGTGFGNGPGCILHMATALLSRSWAATVIAVFSLAPSGALGQTPDAAPRALASRGEDHTTVIPRGMYWDMKADVVDRKMSNFADWYWSGDKSGKKWLAPCNDLTAAIVSGTDYQAIDATFVSGHRLGAAKIIEGTPGNLTGKVIVFKAEDGTLGKLRFAGYRDSHDFTFRSAATLSQKFKDSLQQMPEEKFCHLEVQWQLFPAGAEKVRPAISATGDGKSGSKTSYPPPDVRFVFDFSDLNLNSEEAKTSGLRDACNSFTATTRDRIYPILRDITGVSVGQRWPEIHYKIFSGGETGGRTQQNHITLGQRYSVDRKPPHDVHELLHVFNWYACPLSGVGDHMWHYAIPNAVYARMGWEIPFSRASLVEGKESDVKELKMARGETLRNQRREILSKELGILYFDLGDKAISRLYRCTCHAHPVSQPSAKLVAAWGTEAEQVQALLETLKREYKFTLDEQTRVACGF